MDVSENRLRVRMAIAGGVVVALLLLYLLISWVGSSGLLRFGKTQKRLSSPTPLSGAPIERSVTKIVAESGTYYYRIRGYFLEKPNYKSDTLRGEFVIYDDPKDTQIPVLFTKRGGQIGFGKIEGVITGPAEWSSASTEAVERAISSFTPVELRLTYAPNDPPLGEYARYVESVLERLSSGSWDIPDDLVLIPQSVGAVVAVKVSK